jgi:hypothetical protein
MKSRATRAGESSRKCRTKANGSTRKKHRMLRPRFLIVEVAATVLELADAGNAERTWENNRGRVYTPKAFARHGGQAEQVI